MFQCLECGHDWEAIIFPTTKDRNKHFDIMIILSLRAKSNGGPQKDKSMSYPGKLGMLLCLEGKSFADVKTWILRKRDLSRLSELCLNPDVWVLIRGTQTRDPQTEEEKKWRWRRKNVGLEWSDYKSRNAKNCKQPPEARREAWDRFSPRTRANTLIPNPCSPELWKNTFLLF